MADAVPVRRVLVVEDERFTRSALVEVLQHAGFSVADAHNAVTAKRAIDTFDPDAMIVDIELGEGPSGLDLITAVQKTHSHIAIVLLSNYVPTAADMAPLQRVAYLSKRDSADVAKLLAALEDVLHDVDPTDKYPVTQPSQLAGLTRNQMEILRLLASGATNHDIAAQRGVSVRAIEKALERLYTALDLPRDGRTNRRFLAAAMYADTVGRRQGVIEA